MRIHVMLGVANRSARGSEERWCSECRWGIANRDNVRCIRDFFLDAHRGASVPGFRHLGGRDAVGMIGVWPRAD